jgi:DNA repair exonuclease SbcCD ATPase subunit
MLFAELRTEKLTAIAMIEKQIAELQEALSKEQAHLQAISSVEQALEQVQNAIKDIQSVCPDQLGLFKAEVLRLFANQELDPEPTIEIDPSPTAPDSDRSSAPTPPTIEIEDLINISAIELINLEKEIEDLRKKVDRSSPAIGIDPPAIEMERSPPSKATTGKLAA